jgi:hypothetical protein
MRGMRKISAWALIAVLFTHALGVNILSILYTVDKTVFVDLFCVNKDKPEMNCEGSCMLEKLEKQKKHDSEKPNQTNFSQFQLYYFVQNFEFKLNNINYSELEHHSTYQSFHSSQCRKEIFRPPTLV